MAVLPRTLSTSMAAQSALRSAPWKSQLNLCPSSHPVEQIVDVSVPLIQKEIVGVIHSHKKAFPSTSSCKTLHSARYTNQEELVWLSSSFRKTVFLVRTSIRLIACIPVPHIEEQISLVFHVIPAERMYVRIVEQKIDIPVPQITEQIFHVASSPRSHRAQRVQVVWRTVA